MVELVATVIITVSSIVLFAYWFRYTCLLILSAKTAQDYTCDVAYRNSLGFPEVQKQLKHGGAPDLESLRAALDNDYRVVRNFLKYIPNCAEGQAKLETLMLAVNYQVMGKWYHVARRFSAHSASQALEEMSMVVAHFANLMGEQAASAAA